MSNLTTAKTKNKSHSSYGSYVVGFTLSLSLTLLAFLLVYDHIFNSNGLIAAIIGLALIQLFVQLLFFLHLGRESSSRWNLTFFTAAAVVVCILVFGSLWIMSHLNYHTTAAHQTDQFIIKDEGVKP